MPATEPILTIEQANQILAKFERYRDTPYHPHPIFLSSNDADAYSL